MSVTKKRQGFTLVELIVVITILAILGTVAFISFRGYTKDARNSKKMQQLSSITRKIELEKLNGVSLFAFAANTWATITWWNIHISWYDNYNSFSGSYLAGDLNYSALEAKEDDFIDETFGVPYKFWATSFWERFEVAATIEVWTELDSYIVGNWFARRSSEVRWPRDRIEDNIFFLSGATYYELGFQLNDSVGIASGTYRIVDLKNEYEIHLDTDVTTPWANIFLKTDESRHLIKKWDSNFPIDTNRWELFVPYN